MIQPPVVEAIAEVIEQTRRETDVAAVVLPSEANLRPVAIWPLEVWGEDVHALDGPWRSVA